MNTTGNFRTVTVTLGDLNIILDLIQEKLVEHGHEIPKKYKENLRDLREDLKECRGF